MKNRNIYIVYIVFHLTIYVMTIKMKNNKNKKLNSDKLE